MNELVSIPEYPRAGCLARTHSLRSPNGQWSMAFTWPRLLLTSIWWGRRQCLHFIHEKAGPTEKSDVPRDAELWDDEPAAPRIYQFSAHTVFIFPCWEFSLCFLRRQYNKPEFWLQLNLHRSIADIRQNHRHQSTWQILILCRNYGVLPWLGGKGMECSESTRYRHQGHPVFWFILRPLGASST